MHTTSVSLLERLRKPDDQAAWTRFVQLYTPFIWYWARRRGCERQEAEDLVQDVLEQLVRKLPKFRYDPGKSFRAWLRTVTVNKLRDKRKQRGPPLTISSDSRLDEIPSPEGDDDLDETEYRQHLINRALQLMQSDFAPTTWKACWELVVSERPAQEIATELGITVGAVYAAKFRVLARLREELAGLMD